MSRDGRAENCSMHFPHSPRPCGSFPHGARDGDAVMSRDGRAENCSSAIAPALPYYRPSMDILHFPHSPHPCRSFPQGAREGGAVMSMDGRYSAWSQGSRCGYVQGWTSMPQGAREGGAVIAVQLSKGYASLYEKYIIL